MPGSTGADKNDATMAAINVSGYGDDIDALISFNPAQARPKLQKGDGNLLVRVLTVSLAPGDCRVMSGKTTLVQGPPSMPYVPGGDLCGIVVEVHEDEKTFKVGDCVVAMFDTPGPRGALAEYKLVQTEKAAIKPEGAEFVAATSTQDKLLLDLGVDRVVDYRNENWWELPEFTAKPFDLVIDTWGTQEPWLKAVTSGAVKSGGSNGGRYITLVGDSQTIVFQHWWHIFKLIGDMKAREWWTAVFQSNPSWKYHIGLEPSKGNLARLLKMAEDGGLRVILDSTHRFDAEGVKRAFQIQV